MLQKLGVEIFMMLAIAEVLRDGRTVQLRLSNGTIVPVSRDAAARLKDARWI